MIEMDQLTDSAYYILLSLLEARHGYSIMKYIDNITSGEFSIGPATLYTLIKKLQDAGLIKLLKNNERRKTYKATEHGKTILSNEIQRRSRMVQHGKEAFTLAEEGEKSES